MNGSGSQPGGGWSCGATAIAASRALFAALMFTGCGADSRVAPAPSAPAPAAAAAKPRTYEVGGVVKEIDLPGRKARILHDEIPGYMGRMTMQFDVRDPSDLKAIAAGDRVRFRMQVTETDGWIEGLVKDATTQQAVIPEAPAAASPPKIPHYQPVLAGDPLPDYPLTNQLGRPVLLSHYRGQVVAFTFIFTTCPFPTMCPRMSINLKSAHRLLTSDPSTPTNWHFFSITIDPRTDTPAALTRYAAIQQADPVHWSFLTGEESNIETLGRHFGLNFYREGGALNHNLRTVVVNPNGRVRTILVGNEWKAEELAEEMRAAMAK